MKLDTGIESLPNLSACFSHPSAARTHRSLLSSVMTANVPNGRSRRHRDSRPRATSPRPACRRGRRARWPSGRRAALSRASPAATSSCAIPSLRRSGATASRYMFPRQPSNAAIRTPTIVSSSATSSEPGSVRSSRSMRFGGVRGLGVRGARLVPERQDVRNVGERGISCHLVGSFDTNECCSVSAPPPRLGG